MDVVTADRARPGRGRQPHDAGLGDFREGLREPRGDARAGRLADDADDAGIGVRGQKLERAQHHHTADLIGEIAPANTDGLRHALARARERTGDFLQTGARGGGQPDAPARHRVGEAERHAVEDGRTAVGAHHEQAALQRHALALDLGLDWHVVAEEHDVQPCAQRLQRLGARVRAGHRDQRDVRVRQELQRRAERPRRGARRRGRRRLARDERVFGSVARGVGGGGRVGDDGDDEIRRLGRGAVAREQSRLLEQRAVVRRAHHRRRRAHARDRLHVAREPHERDRVAIVGLADEVESRHRAGRRYFGGVMPYALILR